MGAVSISNCKVARMSPDSGRVEMWIETANTVDDGDTIAVTLKDYGMAADGLMGVDGWIHTTANSVVVAEAPTTAVSAGVLTITVGGSTDNKVRVYRVVGRSSTV